MWNPQLQTKPPPLLTCLTCGFFQVQLNVQLVLTMDAKGQALPVTFYRAHLEHRYWLVSHSLFDFGGAFSQKIKSQKSLPEECWKHYIKHSKPKKLEIWQEAWNKGNSCKFKTALFCQCAYSWALPICFSQDWCTQGHSLNNAAGINPASVGTPPRTKALRHTSEAEVSVEVQARVHSACGGDLALPRPSSIG